MELRVEHLVLDATLVQKVREALGVLDGDSAYQHRLSLLMATLNVVGHGIELMLDGAIDLVIVILANHGAVGGDLLNRQVVDLAELAVLCHGRTGHARELVVEAEVV